MTSIVLRGGIHMEDGAKDDDIVRKVGRALDNGVGKLLSRLFIIVGAPLITGLLAYAAHVTLENISLQIEDVSHKLDQTLLETHQSQIQINGLELSVERLKEHQTNQDERLSQLERRK